MADEKKEEKKQDLVLDEFYVKVKDGTKKENKDDKKKLLKKDLFFILTIFTSLFILIAIFEASEKGSLSGIFNTLFGRASYLIPAIIFFFGLYNYSTKKESKPTFFIYSFLLFLTLATLFHILDFRTAIPEMPKTEIKESENDTNNLTPREFRITPQVEGATIENDESTEPVTENATEEVAEPQEENPEDSKENPLTNDITPAEEPTEETNPDEQGLGLSGRTADEKGTGFWSIVGQGGNGGLIGAFFGSLLLAPFGRLKAALICITLIIILVIFITEKTISSFSKSILKTFVWLSNTIKHSLEKLNQSEEAYAEAGVYDTGEPADTGEGGKEKGIFASLVELISSSFKYDDTEYDYDEDEEPLIVKEAEKTDENYYDDTIVLPKETASKTKKIISDGEKSSDTDYMKPDGSSIDKLFEPAEEIIPDYFEGEEEAPEEAFSDTVLEKSEVSDEADESEAKEEIKKAEAPVKKRPKKYQPPNINLLNPADEKNSVSLSREKVQETAQQLVNTLKSFGVEVKVVGVKPGPTVTRYELKPGEGVKVSKISSLADDIALSLAAQGIRIEAPIPGKSAVGVEVPNQDAQIVFLRDVIDSREFKKSPSQLSFAMGKDIEGRVVVSDIAKMPHLLIAGATGSGKSVCINTLITSILYKASPSNVKLLMIDPKVVELSVYNGIPHLLQPVITDPKKAAGALSWAVSKMIERYKMFSETKVRDIYGYNEAQREESGETMPHIVIIIDELADLMMSSPHEVEDYICRLAQMARAAGMHLIIATQRPSVDVITGIIKANIPSRLAFAVSSGTDSRTILDMVGAEKLLGKGDMLFSPVGINKPKRIQGAFISDKEVEVIVSFLKEQRVEEYDEKIAKEIEENQPITKAPQSDDELIQRAIEFIVKKGKASGSLLQRQFNIGYNKAARIIEELEARGVVGPPDKSKQREVLMTMEEWEIYNSSQK